MRPERIRQVLTDAVTHHQAGRLSEAEALYAQVRACVPRCFDALHLSGLLAHQQGRVADAVDLLGRALRLQPKSAICEVRLGLALLAQGDYAGSEARLRSAIGRRPDLADGWEALALCLKLRDRLEESVGCHRRVVAMRPGSAVSWCNFGLTLSSLGRHAEALQCHDKALAADPGCVAARFGRAQALHQSQRMGEAVKEYEGVLAAEPQRAEARSYRLVALHYIEGVSRERLFAEHVAYGRSLGPHPPPALPNGRDPLRKLRVAFLSPDLRAHSCAFFIEPIIRNLDPSQFELLLYLDHFREDAVSARLRTLAAVWRNLAGMSGEAVERTVRADAPDILIDLAGHACMTSRLPLFARRLAPVQVTYLGYPNTTGVPAMDYRFTDAIADPAPEADRFATERLVRFSRTAWAYQPPADAPEPRPRAPGAPVTFGCFNYIGKITDSTLGVWARILERVPGSRLMLKGSGFGDPGARDRYLARARKMGMDPARMILVERTATVAGHLALYNDIDVALDSFPYHGTTTTCESLWMGVPVVSRAGDCHVSRVGASLLDCVGHPEWSARDDDDYVRIAADLAGDPLRIAGIRATLRGEVAASPLLDHAGQAFRFGEALRGCWGDWCAGRLAAA